MTGQKFEPRVLERQTGFDEYMLDDKAIQKNIDIYRSKDKKAALTENSLSLTSVATLRDEAATLLDRTVIAKAPITRLTDSADLEHWVKQGRALHEERQTVNSARRTSGPSGFLASLESPAFLLTTTT